MPERPAYNPEQIEKKWQKRWLDSGVFNAEFPSDKPKYYCLIEFPYPSGNGLHVGHPTLQHGAGHHRPQAPHGGLQRPLPHRV